MYLHVLARHEQKGPGATIKGNILHSFQKELFPRASRPRLWMTGIPLCEEESENYSLLNRKQGGQPTRTHMHKSRDM